MNHSDYTFELQDWIREEYYKRRTKADDYYFVGERPYRHFDGKVFLESLDTNKSRLIPTLKDPSILVHHSFLPFIRKDKKVRRFSKLKITQKIRPIMYASHKDACIFAFYGYMLKEKYEKRIIGTALADSVLAYRAIKRDDDTSRGKSNIDFANDIFKLVKQYDKCAVLCLDIQKFFDTVDHTLIKARWCRLIGTDTLPESHYQVFRNITKYRYVFLRDVLEALDYGKFIKGKILYKSGRPRGGRLCTPQEYREKIIPGVKQSDGTELIHKNRSNHGIPQGSPISDIIANFYLEDFDRDIISLLHNYDFGHYRRYSDDILIICPVDHVNKIYYSVCQRIKEEKLSINERKTEAVILNNKQGQVEDITYEVTALEAHKDSKRQSFQYLGFEVGPKDLHVRSGTVANHYRRAVRRIKAELDSRKSPKASQAKKNTSDKRRNRSRWQYFISSQRRTNSERIRQQFKKMRRRVEKMSIEKGRRNESI